MALTLGEIRLEYGMAAKKALSKANTGVTKGNVLNYSTGWQPAPLNGVGPFAVAAHTKAAGGSGVQNDITVMVKGVVVLQADAALGEGVYVKRSDATIGNVEAWVNTDNVELIVGRTFEASEATTNLVEVLLGGV